MLVVVRIHGGRNGKHERYSPTRLCDAGGQAGLSLLQLGITSLLSRSQGHATLQLGIKWLHLRLDCHQFQVQIVHRTGLMLRQIGTRDRERLRHLKHARGCSWRGRRRLHPLRRRIHSGSSSSARLLRMYPCSCSELLVDPINKLLPVLVCGPMAHGGSKQLQDSVEMCALQSSLLIHVVVSTHAEPQHAPLLIVGVLHNTKVLE
mmetsp:Transcript_5142/g.12084  ORF Transcript_5142/g.12084 Transcript_5142/m.12084 type:complete len:205 (-) Transcript_5142:528-1142(-)